MTKEIVGGAGVRRSRTEFRRWQHHANVIQKKKVTVSPSTFYTPSLFFMSGAPQRQQLVSERTPLTSFAPAPSTVSCVPLTRNLSPADPSPSPWPGWPRLSEATACSIATHPLYCNVLSKICSKVHLLPLLRRKLCSKMSKGRIFIKNLLGEGRIVIFASDLS